MLRLLRRRLLHAIDNHGLRGTILRVLQRRPSGSHIEAEPSRPEVVIHPFDLRHGCDTSGYVPGEALKSGSKSDLYNTAYYGISPSTLTEAITNIPIDRGKYTFVDLGCGKGRALIVASLQGFENIVGVELSPELVRVAHANAQGYPNIQVHAGDARTYAYPAGPLVVFAYHPFLAPLLRKVLANLICQSPGREVYLLCANPIYLKEFKRCSELSELWSRDLLLSDEDAAADRHGITTEPYTLWHIDRPSA